jgi:hypothetical protein
MKRSKFSEEQVAVVGITLGLVDVTPEVGPCASDHPLYPRLARHGESAPHHSAAAQARARGA